MDVLIGFVTTSEPSSPRGPAAIITTAKAKLPDYVYLIYTDETEPQLAEVIRWIKHDPEILAALKEEPLPKRIDLKGDPTNYELLKAEIPRLLGQIYRNHLGAHVHLVSGLVQVRTIFALSLFAAVVQGTLYEVKPPKFAPKPRLEFYEPQILDSQVANDRLAKIDTAIFNHFRELYEERFQRARLRFYLELEEATLDGKDLRLRTGKDKQRNTFRILLLLACKKAYGLDNDYLTKRQIETAVFGTSRGPQFNDWVKEFNRKIKRDYRINEPYLDALIERKPYAEGDPRNVSHYRLVDELNPAYETIQFLGGNLKSYLISTFGSSILSRFPNLH